MFVFWLIFYYEQFPFKNLSPEKNVKRNTPKNEINTIFPDKYVILHDFPPKFLKSVIKEEYLKSN